MTRPARVALVGLRPTARSMPWLPLLGGAAGAGMGMWLIDPGGGETATMSGLRVTAFLLAAGAAFALDDPAATTLAASPTGLAARRGQRLMLVAPVWAVVWALAVTATQVAWPHGVPVAAATLEAAGMLALAVAAAAIAVPHVAEGRGGVVAGPVLTLAMMSALLAQFLYPRWATLFAFSPGAPEWQASHTRWTVLLVAGIVALVVTSLDPARRSTSSKVMTRVQRRRTGSRAAVRGWI